MLLPAPPLTNAQRQQMFQDRNPGYDRRRKARQRAMLKRGTAAREAEWVAEAKAKAAARAEAAARVDAEWAERAARFAAAAAPPAAVPLAVPVVPPSRWLPAPVVDPMMAALDAMAENLAARRAAVAVPVR